MDQPSGRRPLEEEFARVCLTVLIEDVRSELDAYLAGDRLAIWGAHHAMRKAMGLVFEYRLDLDSAA